MLANRGLPARADAELRPHASHGARGLVGAGFNVAPDHADFGTLRDEFLAEYAGALCVRTTIFPEVPELLDALEASDIRWGVVTNKATRFTLPLLVALDMHRRPGCVVCGDTAARAKPYPDPLFAAAELLALPAAHCIYVGDSERDMQAGRAAGMPTVLARYGYIGDFDTPDVWPADAHVATPLELLNWMRERGAFSNPR
jgi:phosphoglycolate phosphatase